MKLLEMKYVVFTLSIVIHCFVARANEDTLLTFIKDGKIIGLPSRYKNAHFDTLTYTLTVNNRRIIVPGCIRKQFQHIKVSELKFLGYWDGLPPFTLPDYLVLRLLSKEGGFEMVFNLETLEIFEISNFNVTNVNKEIVPAQFEYQVISEECHQSILDSISQF